jgi:hypothetical protein
LDSAEKIFEAREPRFGEIVEERALKIQNGNDVLLAWRRDCIFEAEKVDLIAFCLKKFRSLLFEFPFSVRVKESDTSRSRIFHSGPGNDVVVEITIIIAGVNSCETDSSELFVPSVSRNVWLRKAVISCS